MPVRHSTGRSTQSNSHNSMERPSSGGESFAFNSRISYNAESPTDFPAYHLAMTVPACIGWPLPDLGPTTSTSPSTLSKP
jgi:hypothetical protein